MNVVGERGNNRQSEEEEEEEEQPGPLYSGERVRRRRRQGRWSGIAERCKNVLPRLLRQKATLRRGRVEAEFHFGPTTTTLQQSVALKPLYAPPPPPPSTSQERDRVALNPKTIFAATSLAAPAAAPVQMDQSYWSISDILADATKIPCHFKIDVPGVAHLRGDPSVQAQQEQASQSSSLSKSSASSRQQYEEEGMITKGTRVELPYWLAEWLVLQDCVDVSLPKPYSQRVRNALNAGPKSVQLRGQANWWYAMGSRLGGLMDSEMIMELLSSVSCGTLCRHMGDD